MSRVLVAPQASDPKPRDWPALRAELLRDLQRDEAKWQGRLYHEGLGDRGLEHVEAALSEVCFVLSAIEGAAGPLDAWKRLDAMCAAQARMPRWVSELMSRLSADFYGPVVCDLNEEVAGA